MDNNLLKRLDNVYGKETPPEDACEIERLLYGYQSIEHQKIRFHGLKTCWQDITLPEDFDALVTFIAPVLREFDPISMCFSDLVYICALDVERKTCRNGNLKIFGVSYLGSVAPLAKALAFYGMQLKKRCLGGVIILKGDYTMGDVVDIEGALCNALESDSWEFITTLHYDRTIPCYYSMQVIFRMADGSFAE